MNRAASLAKLAKATELSRLAAQLTAEASAELAENDDVVRRSEPTDEDRAVARKKLRKLGVGL